MVDRRVFGTVDIVPDRHRQQRKADNKNNRAANDRRNERFDDFIENAGKAQHNHQNRANQTGAQDGVPAQLPAAAGGINADDRAKRNIRRTLGDRQLHAKIRLYDGGQPGRNKGRLDQSAGLAGREADQHRDQERHDVDVHGDDVLQAEEDGFADRNFFVG